MKNIKKVPIFKNEAEEQSSGPVMILLSMSIGQRLKRLSFQISSQAQSRYP